MRGMVEIYFDNLAAKHVFLLLNLLGLEHTLAKQISCKMYIPLIKREEHLHPEMDN